ncbi:low temperature requirement protein A [Herbiconiux sp. UC225_62]|uniref:low temperature requirement protein A n=1 Tax=Herbiconiux sp. UC225_62 TaxID=3350168 RepID=UPI0036D2F82E
MASPLELLFDLVFVVAVSQASQNLYVLLAEGRVAEAVTSYAVVFFAVWWAWMNFTWFASAFDNDDWLYRLLTVVQMGGVLVLASGVQSAMLHGDAVIAVWGYVIMRFAMVGQWSRAFASDPATRAISSRYAIGITAIQLLWIARVYLLDERWQLWSFFVLAACEVLVPVWAERRSATRPNPHHIADRYGLFTLILLGESILASATAVIRALQSGEHTPELLALAVAGLIVVAGMWWAYFAFPNARRLTSARASFLFGYGHFVVFAAAGAASAGFEVAIDGVVGSPLLSPAAVGLTLSLPIAIFFAGVWALLLRGALSVPSSAILLASSVAIAAAGALQSFGVVVTLVVIVAATLGIVVMLEVDATRRSRRGPTITPAGRSSPPERSTAR